MTMLNDKERTVAEQLIYTIRNLDSLDSKFNTLFETDDNILSEISRQATDALLTLVGVPDDDDTRAYWYTLTFASNPEPEINEFLDMLLLEVDKQK